MKKKTVLMALGLAIVFQLGVLATEYLTSVYPLWAGKEIRLKTIPVDPRSMFRGNYVRLNYAISDVPVADLWGDIRVNEYVYVLLKRDKDGIYHYAGASRTPPQEGVFIRGRLDSLYEWQDRMDIRYGIEAYFLPREQAKAMEKELADGGIALVMLTNSGKAAIKAVIP